MKSFFRVFWIYLRVSFMNEMQYRVNFFLQLIQSMINLAVGLIVLSLIFQYTDTLGGWLRSELIAVMGVHILVGGILKTFIEPNMARLMTDVQQGTLDYTLTKPEDSQVLISVREFRIWQLVDVLIGLIVLIYGLAELNIQIGIVDTFIFTFAMIMGSMMIYSVWLIITTGSFWFIQMGNIIEVFQSMYEAGRWPVTIYPKWLQTSLTFIVPVAFAVTVPAEAITGRLTSNTLFYELGLTIFLMLLARIIWKIGLKNYSGASA